VAVVYPSRGVSSPDDRGHGSAAGRGDGARVQRLASRVCQRIPSGCSRRHDLAFDVDMPSRRPGAACASSVSGRVPAADEVNGAALARSLLRARVGPRREAESAGIPRGRALSCGRWASSSAPTRAEGTSILIRRANAHLGAFARGGILERIRGCAWRSWRATAAGCRSCSGGLDRALGSGPATSYARATHQRRRAPYFKSSASCRQVRRRAGEARHRRHPVTTGSSSRRIFRTATRSFPRAVESFLRLPISEESKRKILWDNCRGVLRPSVLTGKESLRC